jgi:hypothetical protein
VGQGEEYSSRSAETQGRLLKQLAGNYIDAQGNVLSGKEQDYANLRALMPKFVDALRNVKVTGFPIAKSGKGGKLELSSEEKERLGMPPIESEPEPPT